MALIPKHGALPPPMTKSERETLAGNPNTISPNTIFSLPGDVSYVDSINLARMRMESMKLEEQRRLMKQHYNMVASEGWGLMDGEEYRIRMIGMRLRLKEGEAIPFQRIATAETPDTVFVFVVHNDKYVVLEDDPNLFPSDTLITQLRLLT